MLIYIQTTNKIYSIEVDSNYTFYDVKESMEDKINVKSHAQILIDKTQSFVYKDHEKLKDYNIQEKDTIILVYKC